MKVARKLTLVFVVVMAAVLSLDAWISLRKETALLEADMHSDERYTGGALASAFTQTWKAEGQARAIQLLDGMNLTSHGPTVRWVDPRAVRGSRDAPGREEARARIAMRETFSLLDRTAPEGGRLYTYVPVHLEGGPQGAVELSESLKDEHDHLRSLVLQRIVTTSGIAVLSTFLAGILGAWIVGRPMHALVAKARRVGTGDLSGPLEMKQHDEIGELATELNAMCEQLNVAHEKLQAEIKARIAALEQLRHADRLATVGQLAAGIAHELGTPLNVVAQRAKMIATGEVGGGDAADGARIVFEQSQRITGVIRQLLDFARRRTPQKTPCDLRSVAEATVGFLGPLAKKRNVELKLVLPPERLDCEVDAGQMQQVLTNLVVNGLHACSPGGLVRIVLDRKHAAPPADVGGEAGEYVQACVQDTGHGIPPEHVARIFEPFFTTKDVGEGTGLGLAVSWGIVREHGGWIEVQNDFGHGATFAVYLPARMAEVTA